MFIDRDAQLPPRRSEERNGSRRTRLNLNSAPPNGAGDFVLHWTINMSPLRGED